MIILHCISKKAWEGLKGQQYFGQGMIDAEGFIHCSSIEYFWRVASNFRDFGDELVLLCIETDELKAEIKWEDGDNCSREYPHVYGLINTSSVKQVLEYCKDRDGNWQKNEELKGVENK